MLPPPRSHHTPPPPPHAPQFRQGMFKLEFKARQHLEGGSKPAASAAVPRPASSELNDVIHHDAAFRQQAMVHLRRLLDAFDLDEEDERRD